MSPTSQTDSRFVTFGEEHLARALEIYNHYVRTSTATFQITDADLDQMRGIIMQSGPHCTAWAVMDGGSMVGYVVVGRHKAREAYALTAEVAIYLDPQARGRGLGRAGMELAERHARSVGLHVLVASITATNQASIALSVACGYEKCAHYRQVGRKFDTWLDVVSYQKILDDQPVGK